MQGRHYVFASHQKLWVTTAENSLSIIYFFFQLLLVFYVGSSTLKFIIEGSIGTSPFSLLLL